MSEPDQIDMMSECELRTELREVLRQDNTAEIVALIGDEILKHLHNRASPRMDEPDLAYALGINILNKIKALDTST